MELSFLENVLTTSLSNTLRQLHIKLSYNDFHNLTPNLSISMVKLHTFTLVQILPSMLTIELTVIGSSPLFIDYRHVDVKFVFHLINCPQYINVTPFIPCDNRFHPREIVGVTLIVNHWSDRSEQIMDVDPYVSYCSAIFLFFLTIK